MDRGFLDWAEPHQGTEHFINKDTLANENDKAR